MMRSMFSVVSGLRSHQTKMDVIGNNIANINTIGYKAGRVTFREIFSQTIKAPSAPDANTGRGGTNPMQIGLGIEVSSIDTNMARGTVQRTDVITDLSIEGEGFFVVRESSSDPYKFTRAGNFRVDELGNLVTGNGMAVCGWLEYTISDKGEYIFNTINQLESINIYNDSINGNKRLIRAQATTQATFAGNLSANSLPIPEADRTIDNAHYITPVTVYSPIGKEYKVNICFWRGPSESYTITDESGNTVNKIATQWHWRAVGDVNNSDVLDLPSAEGELLFDDEGNILFVDPTSTPIDGYTVTPTIRIDSGVASGSKPFEIKLDFKSLSMFATVSSVKPISRDGYPAGSMTSYSISQDGIIMGIYSNGQQQPLGMIGLAVFDNPSGLAKVGNNLFEPTANSGEFRRGIQPGTEDAGRLNPGTLEMSNVDLSQEFIDMIVTQRGFQANSRIVTATDEMLQEMVNIRR